MSEERKDGEPLVELPLDKLQMLEEEYAALHGPLPEDYRRASGHERAARLPRMLHERNRSALCLSGGGIRSATFALGVIQGLAKRGLLARFDYLSTVSGGGYIGSWLSAWARRAPDGIKGVQAALSKGVLKPTLESDAADPAPETKREVAIGRGGVGECQDEEGADPHAIGHLRRFSNYLTPKMGLMSADTWTVVATYLRNLLVNWSVFIPLLVGVLLLPRLCVPCARYETSMPVVIAMLALGIGLLVTAMTVTGLSVPSVAIDRDGCKPNSPEYMARRAWLGQGGFLRGVFLPLCGAEAALSTAWAWYRNVNGVNGPIPPWWWFVVAGMGMYLLTLIFTLVIGQRKSLGTNLRAYLRMSVVVVFPMVGAVGGLLVYVAAAHVFASPERHPRWFASFAVPILLGIHVLTGTMYVGLTSRTSDPRDDEDREWWARAGGWFLIAIVAWTVFSAIVLVAPALLTEGFWRAASPIVGVIAGGATMFLSASSGTAAETGDHNKPRGLVATLSRLGLSLAAPTFIVFLVSALSYLTDGLLSGRLPTDPAQHRAIVMETDLWVMVAWMVGLILVAVIGARIININKFSMHAMYRNRLIRAYLGASRQRHPNLFTGFDAEDNLQMYNLRSRPIKDGPHLTEANLSDVPGLLNMLRDKENWLSARVWPLCANAAALGVGRDDSKEMRDAILKDLNAVVNGATAVGAADALDAPRNPAQTGTQHGSKADSELDWRKRHPDKPFAAISHGYLYDGGHDWRRLPRAVIRRVRAPMGEPSPGDPTMAERNRHLLEHVYEGHILPGAQRPLHVVNLALNVVGGDQLAWQERKAESFTVSPLHCGNHRLGYRRSLFFGGPDGISLGTAITISGAAVSPNMGYHSSAPMALLMTFFNVRLGWWLGNPGKPGAPHDPPGHGKSAQWKRSMERFLAASRRLGGYWASGLDPRSYRHSAPRFSIAPVVREAFGLTDERSKYVYLSDGGHFENLGLYEMVLRRCRLIVLSDGGCDPKFTFEDLGNAIRKIRVDLGIEIDIEIGRLFSRDSEGRDKGKHCAIGRIGYKAADGAEEDGVLVYIKPSIPGGEPADVHNYASVNKEFPHEGTGDQWFSESQFESYRALGEHTLDRVCSGGSPFPPHTDWAKGLEEFRDRARSYVVFGTMGPDGETIKPGC